MYTHSGVVPCAHCIASCRRFKCGIRFEPLSVEHPFDFVAFTYVAVTAQPGKPTGLAFRRLAAVLQCDDCDQKPNQGSGGVVPTVFPARRQRRADRPAFSASFNWVSGRYRPDAMITHICPSHLYRRSEPRGCDLCIGACTVALTIRSIGGCPCSI